MNSLTWLSKAIETRSSAILMIGSRALMDYDDRVAIILMQLLCWNSWLSIIKLTRLWICGDTILVRVRLADIARAGGPYGQSLRRALLGDPSDKSMILMKRLVIRLRASELTAG